MSIDAPPTAPADPSPVPQRSDPANFRARGDTFLAWLPAFRTYLIAALANVYNNALEAFSKATAAAASALGASTSEANAAVSAQVSASAAGAAPWVSGTYAANACAVGIARPLVYRRKAPGGASPTDPAMDPTNWALASTVGLQMVPVTATSVDASPGGWYAMLNAAASTTRLPAVPTIGDSPIGVAPSNLRTDNVVDAQGLPIHGSTATRFLNIKGEAFTFTWVGLPFGWFVNRFIVPGSPASDAITPAQAQAVTQRLVTATGGIKGYVGPVSKDNFGVNWVFTPIHYGFSVGTGLGTANDDTEKLAGTEGSGWVRIFFGLSSNNGASGLFAAGTTTMVANRLTDLRYILDFWHARGKKVLLTLDAPTSTAGGDTTLWRDRLAQMLVRLPNNNALQIIDAVEFFNEPYGPVFGTGGSYEFNVSGGFAMLAERQRMGHTLFKAFSPQTIVCSPTFQGGETGAVEQFMASSAAGATVRGSSGAGTRGEMFFDVVAYHPYPTATTLALANLAFSEALIERTIRLYSTFIQTAVANRRLDTVGGGAAWWAGKPDPEYWATELAVSFNGANITSNTEFRMQAYGPAKRRRLLESLFLGCFCSGYSKVFPYAVDHSGGGGPWDPTAGGFTTGANGDIRILGSLAPVFDGDLVFLAGGSMPFAGEAQGVAYNATSNGLAFDVAGVPAGSAPTYITFKRWLLGGFHQEWASVQDSLIGQMEAGFVATGNTPDSHLPQVRVNRGFIRRVQSGVLTDLEV